MPAVTGQLLRVCDRVLVMRGTRSFSGASFPPVIAPPLDPRVEIVSVDFATEHETRNAGMQWLSDCDYIFTIDSDEIFTVEALEQLKQAVPSHPALAVQLRTYWKTPRWQIEPPEKISATVIAHRSVKFLELRRIAGLQGYVNARLMHHLSYVRTDEEVQEKIRLFGHAKEVVPDWYENIWKAWDRDHGLRNLHPTHPHAFRRTIHVREPELEAILQDYGIWEVAWSR